MDLFIKNARLIFVFIFICTHTFSQDYTIETIKLWKDGEIPFNKEHITLKETLDEAGVRYTQISEPALYVYKNKTVKKNGAALLVCPGGGYAKVTIGGNNGEGKAKRFLEMGFNVVAVLKYRLPDTQIVNSQEKVPLCDAQKALSIIHQNATNWTIDKNKVAVIGSSAGGHLAASLANLKDEIIAPNVKQEELKQAVSILMYPVISFNLPYRHKGSYKRLLADKAESQMLLDYYYSMENQVSENTPQTYIIHAKDDVGVVYQNSLIYCESLKKHDVNYKYVQLDKGGHGFGFSFNRTGVDWTIELEKWLHKETNLFKN
ncbi:Acetyl esterase/lipase [Lutibacter agarilyticus]|uniref:Acetyl esterase/lipase n=1 Tax=Lutibacter agarilyticus TaxID=1109740 RepID=A0A238YKV2_9FLAO|nr:alpha/beta hydrolase [Lutibacter agarilyticus]SNR71428.1 Acetyl esterase/lipase [Lutibacter agarilyticus]